MDKKSIADKARTALSPVKPAGPETMGDARALFMAKRTDAGRSLPAYYLVYFLLVDLLGFKNSGQFEKVAWSVPVDYNGKAFVVEHRKLGLGIFATDLPADEPDAEEIAKRIRAAVDAAKPYFDHLADQAADTSRLNVENRAAELYARHEYFLIQYEAKRAEAEARRKERVTKKRGSVTTTAFPAISIRREAKWLALSAIESFFSWTEHVFIHIAILQGALLTGRDVKRLANANWHDKFKTALDLSDSDTRKFYDELTIVRQQLRNFDAHGSFGKNRDAFSFHSAAGAVPLRLPYQRTSDDFRFGRGVEFVDHDAIELIRSFTDHLWSGARTPAKLYIQESGLPLILTQAADGTYADAMSSEEAMTEFMDYQMALHDRYANMDF